MQICFILSDLRASTPAGALRVEGARCALSVVRDTHGGLFYPHIAEDTTPEAYRFFAGRLYALPPSNALPAGHPVCAPLAEEWTFSGSEPDGSWIALKFDRKRDVLSAAADLFNVQRWFYRRRGDELYLSNSLQFLFKVSGCDAPLEERAVPYLLEWGYLPCHLTPLKDVFELDIGEVLTVRDGKHAITQRKPLPIHRRPVNSGTDQSAMIGDVLASSVKECLSGLDRVTLPLSGGIDSRFLLGCALEVLDPAQITTITFGSPGGFDARFGVAVARSVGVNSLSLEADRRPIGEILKDNFATSEGMYCSTPDYPVTAFHSALADHGYVLSGYIGDPVFGAKEKGSEFETAVTGHEDELAVIYRKTASFIPWEDVQPLLSVADRDPFRIYDRYASLPGKTMQERLDYWYFGPHTTNRTHYAVFPARYKTFFLTPFISRAVLDYAFSMPPEERRARRAYFAAIRRRYAELYRFPTTNNFGFPLETSAPLRIAASRSWRKVWLEVDERVGGALGTILYRHPRFAYNHPRELLRSIHKPFVLESLEALSELSIFDSRALAAWRDRYRKGRGINPWLPRHLLTVHQWMLNYRK
jgi:asparagine synthetase B (glutamine-hydrolysing)